MGRLVVVGASLAGLRVAEAARSAGFAGELVLVGDEPHLPYNRPPLSKEALARGVAHADVAFRLRAGLGDVVWELGRPAVGCDVTAGSLTLGDGRTLGFDALAVTTGVRPRRLRVPGPAGGRHVVRTLDDAARLRGELVPGTRVVIAGAGFVGCEVAATAVGLGCTVHVVAPDAEPLVRPLGEVVGAAVRRRHEAHGVTFHLGVSPTHLEAAPGDRDAGRVAAVVLSDGTRLAADVVVEALGCVPDLGWLSTGSGGPGDEALDLRDGVRTDGLMRALRTDGTPAPNVVAAGDVARFPNPRYDDVPRRVEHWNIPTDTGRRAGATIAALLAGADLPDTPFAPLPSFWSDQYGERLQSFGALGLADEVRILTGDVDGPFVAEYLHAGRRVGVLGVGEGTMSVLLGLRAELAAVP